MSGIEPSSPSSFSSLSSSSKYDAVLLISFGGPEKFEDVRPFLANVLKGIRVPQERIEEVVNHYQRIGGASPLNQITQQQAEQLEAALSQAGLGVPVVVGMRHWHPLMAEVLGGLVAKGAKRVLGVIMSAHRSEASVDKYRRTVDEALASLGSRAPRVDYVEPWFDHPLFIQAMADRVEESVGTWSVDRRRQSAWIFTAHSIPEVMAKASTYVNDLRVSIQGVVEKVGLKDWRLGYQSRSGSPLEPWLGPDVLTVLREEAAKGMGEAVLIPAGFVADHVEVLYDLDVEAVHVARELGMGVTRVPTVGTHPQFIAMLVDMVRRAMQGLVTHE